MLHLKKRTGQPVQMFACSGADLTTAIRRMLLFASINAQQAVYMVTLAPLMQAANHCLSLQGMRMLMSPYTLMCSRPAMKHMRKLSGVTSCSAVSQRVLS